MRGHFEDLKRNQAEKRPNGPQYFLGPPDKITRIGAYNTPMKRISESYAYRLWPKTLVVKPASPLGRCDLCNDYHCAKNATWMDPSERERIMVFFSLWLSYIGLISKKLSFM